MVFTVFLKIFLQKNVESEFQNGNFGNRPKKVVARKGRNVKNSQIFEKKFLEPEASLTKMNFNENLKIAKKILRSFRFDQALQMKFNFHITDSFLDNFETSSVRLKKITRRKNPKIKHFACERDILYCFESGYMAKVF